MLALILAIVFLAAMVYYNSRLFCWFIGGLILVAFVFQFFMKNKDAITSETMMDNSATDV